MGISEITSPTQKAIVAVLMDGKPHTREELLGCLDELSSLKTLQVHICGIRKAINSSGLHVVCELANNRIHYRMVRLV